MMHLPRNVIYRYLGLPQKEDVSIAIKERIKKAQDWLAEYGAFQVYFVSVKVFLQNCQDLWIEDKKFTSQHLHKIITDYSVQKGFVVLVFFSRILDEQLEFLWREGMVDEAYFLDSLATSCISFCVQTIEQRFEKEISADETCLAGISPGHFDWSLREQKSLFSFLQKTYPFLQATVLDSGMIIPHKAQLFFLPVTKKSLPVRQKRGCQVCEKTDCTFRLNYNPPPLTYSFSVKALKKWSSLYLKKEEKSNEETCFRFTFNGTTCNNLGVPFTMNYLVFIWGKGEAAKISDMQIELPSEDDSWAKMCGARREIFFQEINTKPDLGVDSLYSILSWDPPVAMSGCLCQTANRNHKWKLVLQTIHYEVFVNDHAS